MIKKGLVLVLMICFLVFLGCKKQEEKTAEGKEEPKKSKEMTQKEIETSQKSLPSPKQPVIPPAADTTAPIVGKTVMVNVEDMNFRSEPGPDSPLVQDKEVLYKGEKAKVLAVTGDWYYIQTHDGYYGWARVQFQGKKYLIEIK